ncbi:MAG: PAS domain S-box protein [Chloroflexi bacterium]|nr:PAS domain S-box protein [Chloroflexota bacterium]
MIGQVSLEKSQKQAIRSTPGAPGEEGRLLLDSASGALAIVQDGFMRKVNASLLSLIDYSEEELTSRSFLEFIHPDDRHVVADNYVKRLQDGEAPAAYAFRIITKHGDVRWVQLNSLMLQGEGKTTILAFLTDITEGKRAEEALVRQEKRFQALTENSSDAIIIVSRDGIVCYESPSYERISGFKPEERVGTSMFERLHPQDTKMVAENFARLLNNPGTTLRVEVRIQHRNGSWRTMEATGTSLLHDPAVEGVVVNLRDITERHESRKRLEQSLEKLQRTMQGTIQAVTAIAEWRDPFTAGHQKRVAQLACAIAREMDFPPEQIEVVHMAGLLHDIGKISVPHEILSKPGRLSDAEMGLIRIHSQVAYDILKTVDFPWPIADMVVQHHERIDGSGYPAGLREDEILMEARILAVADVVEAMTAHRPYRKAPGLDKALEEISRNSGRLYDAEVVYACLRLFNEKGFAFALDSGESAASLV